MRLASAHCVPCAAPAWSKRGGRASSFTTARAALMSLFQLWSNVREVAEQHLWSSWVAVLDRMATAPNALSSESRETLFSLAQRRHRRHRRPSGKPNLPPAISRAPVPCRWPNGKDWPTCRFDKEIAAHRRGRFCRRSDEAVQSSRGNAVIPLTRSPMGDEWRANGLPIENWEFIKSTGDKPETFIHFRPVRHPWRSRRWAPMCPCPFPAPRPPAAGRC